MFANFAVFAVLEKRDFDHGKIQGGNNAAAFPKKLAPKVFECFTGAFADTVYRFVCLFYIINDGIAHHTAPQRVRYLFAPYRGFLPSASDSDLKSSKYSE